MEFHEMTDLETSLERTPSAEPTDNSPLLDPPPNLLTSSTLDREADDDCRFALIRRFTPWFPKVGRKTIMEQGFLKRLSDRDAALLVHQIVAFTVFLFNLVVASLAIHKHGFKGNGGDLLGPNDSTTCDDVKFYNKLLHFAINALSTILLGSSNYCAQILVAPTREELNRAHGKKQWYDIGVQSRRNLGKIDATRKALWFGLMISSALLHLIWNSAIFAAIPVSSYNVAVVTQDFATDESPWDNATPRLQDLRKEAAIKPDSKRIDRAECIKRYVAHDAGLTDLIVVTSNLTMEDEQSLGPRNSSSLLSYITTPSAPTDWNLGNTWLCSAWQVPGERPRVWCTEEFLGPHSDSWTFHGDDATDPADVKEFWAQIDYCIPAGEVDEMDKKCALRVSTIILTSVCILNLFKCICICWTAQKHRTAKKATNSGNSFYRYALAVLTRDKSSATTRTSQKPQSPTERGPEYLVTIGDAIASYLEVEDTNTTDLPVVGKEDFTGSWPDSTTKPTEPHPKRWYHAASKARWAVTISLVIAMLGISSGLLSMAIRTQQAKTNLGGFSSWWHYGLGDAQTWAIALTSIMRKMDQTAGFYTAAFFANVFQVISSGLYLLYNNLLTVLLVGKEWNDFILERKPLRLSSPRGIQQSSYFLSLPYAYGIPLTITSGFLHWIISQSVFVIQTIGYSQNPETPEFEKAPEFDASVVGFSSLGIALSISTGFVMVITLLALGFFKKYKPKDKNAYPMPLVSTCSAAISAACHKHKADKDATFLPLTWGFVTDDPAGKPSQGRFCFTTVKDVRYPRFLEVYNDGKTTSSV